MKKISVGGNAVFNGINFRSQSLDVKVRRKGDKITHTTRYFVPTKIKENKKKSFFPEVNFF